MQQQDPPASSQRPAAPGPGTRSGWGIGPDLVRQLELKCPNVPGSRLARLSQLLPRDPAGDALRTQALYHLLATTDPGPDPNASNPCSGAHPAELDAVHATVSVPQCSCQYPRGTGAAACDPGADGSKRSLSEPPSGLDSDGMSPRKQPQRHQQLPQQLSQPGSRRESSASAVSQGSSPGAPPPPANPSTGKARMRLNRALSLFRSLRRSPGSADSMDSHEATSSGSHGSNSLGPSMDGASSASDGSSLPLPQLSRSNSAMSIASSVSSTGGGGGLGATATALAEANENARLRVLDWSSNRCRVLIYHGLVESDVRDQLLRAWQQQVDRLAALLQQQQQQQQGLQQQHQKEELELLQQIELHRNLTAWLLRLMWLLADWESRGPGRICRSALHDSQLAVTILPEVQIAAEKVRRNEGGRITRRSKKQIRFSLQCNQGGREWNITCNFEQTSRFRESLLELLPELELPELIAAREDRLQEHEVAEHQRAQLQAFFCKLTGQPAPEERRKKSRTGSKSRSRGGTSSGAAAAAEANPDAAAEGSPLLAEQTVGRGYALIMAHPTASLLLKNFFGFGSRLARTFSHMLLERTVDATARRYVASRGLPVEVVCVLLEILLGVLPDGVVALPPALGDWLALRQDHVAEATGAPDGSPASSSKTAQDELSRAHLELLLGKHFSAAPGTAREALPAAPAAVPGSAPSSAPAALEPGSSACHYCPQTGFHYPTSQVVRPEVIPVLLQCLAQSPPQVAVHGIYFLTGLLSMRRQNRACFTEASPAWMDGIIRRLLPPQRVPESELRGFLQLVVGDEGVADPAGAPGSSGSPPGSTPLSPRPLLRSSSHASALGQHRMAAGAASQAGDGFGRQAFASVGSGGGPGRLDEDWLRYTINNLAQLAIWQFEKLVGKAGSEHSFGEQLRRLIEMLAVQTGLEFPQFMQILVQLQQRQQQQQQQPQPQPQPPSPAVPASSLTPGSSSPKHYRFSSADLLQQQQNSALSTPTSGLTPSSSRGSIAGTPVASSASPQGAAATAAASATAAAVASRQANDWTRSLHPLFLLHRFLIAFLDKLHSGEDKVQLLTVLRTYSDSPLWENLEQCYAVFQQLLSHRTTAPGPFLPAPPPSTPFLEPTRSVSISADLSVLRQGSATSAGGDGDPGRTPAATTSSPASMATAKSSSGQTKSSAPRKQSHGSVGGSPQSLPSLLDLAIKVETAEEALQAAGRGASAAGILKRSGSNSSGISATPQHQQQADAPAEPPKLVLGQSLYPAIAEEDGSGGDGDEDEDGAPPPAPRQLSLDSAEVSRRRRPSLNPGGSGDSDSDDGVPPPPGPPQSPSPGRSGASRRHRNRSSSAAATSSATKRGRSRSLRRRSSEADGSGAGAGAHASAEDGGHRRISVGRRGRKASENSASGSGPAAAPAPGDNLEGFYDKDLRRFLSLSDEEDLLLRDLGVGCPQRVSRPSMDDLSRLTSGEPEARHTRLLQVFTERPLFVNPLSRLPTTDFPLMPDSSLSAAAGAGLGVSRLPEGTPAALSGHRLSVLEHAPFFKTAFVLPVVVSKMLALLESLQLRPSDLETLLEQNRDDPVECGLLRRHQTWLQEQTAWLRRRRDQLLSVWETCRRVHEHRQKRVLHQHQHQHRKSQLLSPAELESSPRQQKQRPRGATTSLQRRSRAESLMLVSSGGGGGDHSLASGAAFSHSASTLELDLVTGSQRLGSLRPAEVSQFRRPATATRESPAVMGTLQSKPRPAPSVSSSSESSSTTDSDSDLPPPSASSEDE